VTNVPVTNVHATDVHVTNVHVESVGLGPPLVLLHGWAMHSGLW